MNSKKWTLKRTGKGIDWWTTKNENIEGQGKVLMGTGRESIPRLFVCAQEMKVRIGRCRNASSTSIHQHQPRPPTQFLHHFSPNIFFWPNFSTFSFSSTPFSPSLHLLFIHIVPFSPNQHLFLKPSRTKWCKWGDGWVKCPAPTWPTNPTTQGPTQPHFFASYFFQAKAGIRVWQLKQERRRRNGKIDVFRDFFWSSALSHTIDIFWTVHDLLKKRYKRWKSTKRTFWAKT